MRTVLHIDFDSFFASCEQQFNPNFRGKPLGITATNGRTCIIASSCQAKRLGIKTGCRTYEAKKICPDIVFAPADFVKYLAISKKFLNICKDYSPFVELFSIDEVFIDATLTIHLFDNTCRLIEKIKNRIKNEIGEYITVSVGVSHNKLLAKMASSINKPNGMAEIRFNDIDNVYSQAQLTDVCGIGQRIKSRLNKIGIYNLMQLRKTSILTLIEEFGKIEARFLKNVGLLIDESPVIPYTNPPSVKSVGRNYCLPKNECDKRIILQNVYELCEEIAIKLRRLNKKARTVGITLRGNINIGGRKTYKNYFDSGKEIFDLCQQLFNINNLGYARQISVWAANLEDKENIPLSLFDSLGKNEKLASAIDSINQRFGDHTIRNGFLLYANKLTTVPNGYMADKYYYL
ncbi:MAG: hypothetical protein ABH816_03315 [Candidatus Levyibacteriota bacterium]